MKFLTPLGLLGLLGILVLILIYIIKPNYQQKFVSSTYIWKLSLKYKKKRLPLNKLRNLLLILCQVLILAGCAAALATPVQVLKEQPKDGEVIAVIDASASMRSFYNESTRFERAVNKVSELSDTVFENKGVVSIIMANDNPEYLIKKATVENQNAVDDALSELLDDPSSCTYGSANIEEAIRLSEDIIAENPKAKIYLYTDTTYTYVPDNIEVVKVNADGNEINASILSAKATLVSGYYRVTVQVALYGANGNIRLNMDVMGANAANLNESGERKEIAFEVDCSDDEVQTVVFCVAKNDSGDTSDSDDNLTEEEKKHTTYCFLGDSDRFYSYQSILLSIEEDGRYEDCFPDDNTFSIYGGQKEVVKIKYASTLRNPFVSSALTSMKKAHANNWDFRVTACQAFDKEVKDEDFDLYIYEHHAPEILPDDGIVFLLDPRSAPNGSGLFIRDELDFNKQLQYFTEDVKDDDVRSPIFNNINVSNIGASRILRIDDNGSYTKLMSCGDYPMLMVRNDLDCKVALMSFSVHFSNIVLLEDFPVLLNNLFKYFHPTTLEGNYFEVGASIPLNSRGNSITVKSENGDGSDIEVEKFPSSVTLSSPGTYRIQQKGVMGKEAPDIQIYVKIPAAESNINAVIDSLYDPFEQDIQYDYFKDILVYLAAAIVALLFIEWLLQLRENM